MFRPAAQQFATMIRLQHRTSTNVNGQPRLVYTDAIPPLRACNWRPFYGAEAIQAGTLQITDGATVTTWFDAGIKAQDRLLLNDDSMLAYEVISVENIEQRNMYTVIKVRRAVNA